MLLVILASKFLPVIFTVMTSFMLGVGITVPVLIGSELVVSEHYGVKRVLKILGDDE